MLNLIVFLVFSSMPAAQSTMVETMRLQRQLTVESDFAHPCVRDCDQEHSMMCYYKFIVDWYTSMSVMCGDCPHNVTHCYNPGCIVGGGIVRPVISVNRRTPGPAIMVCANDTIVVDVTNSMDREELTIHWHGVHQVGTPYMDGAPYVTQCPIPPGNSFRYQFTAAPHGTHMWHGHTGYHDSSGLFGPFIVRRSEPPNIRNLYDHDLPEHTITVWHWYNETDSSVLPPVLDTYSKVYGYGLLINGHAPFGKFKSRTNSSQVISTPRAKFFVKKGQRYRFRLIVNSAIYCPVQFSIDNHNLTMIASETAAYQPIVVDSVMLSAGERFSFVVVADKKEACYWIRLRGMGDCGASKSSTHGEAFLCYNGLVLEPEGREPTYDQGKRPGKLLNPVEVFKGEDYSKNELVFMSDLTASEPESTDYNRTPDVTMYLELHAQLYSEADAPGPWPQFNRITYEPPPFSMLPQRSLLAAGAGAICVDYPTNSNYCIGSFCTCTFTKKVKLNSLVEVVMVDISVAREQDHPIHMHGYWFYPVAMGTVGDNVSLDLVRNMNENNMIPKRLEKVPSKDTISVPNAGYAIIRFVAKNPGFWLFHCHVTNHMMLGMAMVLQVGEHHEMPEVPPNFPTCGHDLYDPDGMEKSKDGGTETILGHPWIISLTTFITYLTFKQLT